MTLLHDSDATSVSQPREIAAGGVKRYHRARTQSRVCPRYSADQALGLPEARGTRTT